MWTYDALRAALAGLEALSNADAAAMLSAEVDAGIRDIPTAEIETTLLDSLEWGALQYIAERGTVADGIPKKLIAAAMTIMRTVDRKTIVETTVPERLALYQQMIATFVAAGIIVQATADALLALRNTTTPRWVPAPTADDVAFARKG